MYPHTWAEGDVLESWLSQYSCSPRFFQAACPRWQLLQCLLCQLSQLCQLLKFFHFLVLPGRDLPDARGISQEPDSSQNLLQIDSLKQAWREAEKKSEQRFVEGVP